MRLARDLALLAGLASKCSGRRPAGGASDRRGPSSAQSASASAVCAFLPRQRLSRGRAGWGSRAEASMMAAPPAGPRVPTASGTSSSGFGVVLTNSVDSRGSASTREPDEVRLLLSQHQADERTVRGAPRGGRGRRRGTEGGRRDPRCARPSRSRHRRRNPLDSASDADGCTQGAKPLRWTVPRRLPRSVSPTRAAMVAIGSTGCQLPGIRGRRRGGDSSHDPI